MSKKVVQFSDGTYGVQRSWFFGLYKSYLSTGMNWWWSDSLMVNKHCKTNKDEAERLLKLFIEPKINQSQPLKQKSE